MKNSFERQVESLIQQRFRERDRCFDGRLVEVMQEYNGRGILRSSIAVGAMHAELEREFEESASGCVKAAVDAMTSRPTALPLPRKRKVLRVCSDILTRRKAALEAIFQGCTRSILASLSNSGLTAPYRSLSKSFVQLQCEKRLRGASCKAQRAVLVEAQSNTEALPFAQAAPVGVRGGNGGVVFRTLRDRRGLEGSPQPHRSGSAGLRRTVARRSAQWALSHGRRTIGACPRKPRIRERRKFVGGTYPATTCSDPRGHVVGPTHA